MQLVIWHACNLHISCIMEVSVDILLYVFALCLSCQKNSHYILSRTDLCKEEELALFYAFYSFLSIENLLRMCNDRGY